MERYDDMDWDKDKVPSDQFPVWGEEEEYETMRIVPRRERIQLPPSNPPYPPLKQVVQEEVHKGRDELWNGCLQDMPQNFTRLDPERERHGT